MKQNASLASQLKKEQHSMICPSASAKAGKETHFRQVQGTAGDIWIKSVLWFSSNLTDKAYANVLSLSFLGKHFHL